IGFSDYADLLARYDTLQKISFDYAVVERETNIAVVRYPGSWADLGTWNTLTEAMQENAVGDARLDAHCENVHVFNQLDVPVLCMGLKNMVIAASPEGILVADKQQSSHIKPYVDQMDQQIMFAEKSWGSYQVLDAGAESLTIKVTLLAGHQMHYHSHERRDETWTVVSGEGVAVVDDAEITLRPGTMLRLPMGCRHTLIAREDMTVIEVQIGRDISVDDKKKYTLEL
ncbi:MAG: cupin domain-containing protein, partial [Oscillospiraceae bacterium]|nr:cupin domain-containing protein [Oscillospiraceae bacterium]